MRGVDRSRIAYRVGGHTVRLASPRVASPLFLVVEVRAGRVYATVTGDDDVYDLAGASWGAQPPVGAYARTVMSGSQAVFVPSGQATTITARVPVAAGGTRTVSTDVLLGSVGNVPDVQMHTTARGPATVPIEAQFGFREYTEGVARLYRTATGVPGRSTPERSLIHETEAVFPAGQGVRLSHPVTFPAVVGVGAGYEFEWEVALSGGHAITSRMIPLWVIGDAPECAPPDPATVPALEVPDIFKRPASSYGQVTPPAGRTYADCVASFLRQWKGAETGANLPGGWLNFDRYNMALCVVDLDDGTVPRHDIVHTDDRNWGYTPPGWYGTDSGAVPWPRENVARAVPIPHYARPAHGTDRSLTIVGMRGDQIERVWELWLATRRADGAWRAETVGTTTIGERYQHSAGYTVTASGICQVAGAITLSEMTRAVGYVRAERAAGRTPDHNVIVSHVNKPLCVAMPEPRGAVISYPATFTDGSHSDPTVPAEGQLFHLRQNLDINTPNLTAFKYVLAVVLQRRGCFVTDRTNWNTSFMVEGDITYTGTEWTALLDPGESWTVAFPDDAWVIGKIYSDKASFDADTP